MVKKNQMNQRYTELRNSFRSEEHPLPKHIAWLENVAQRTNSATTLRLAIALVTDILRYRRRATRVHKQMLSEFQLSPTSAYRALETLKNEGLIDLTRANKQRPLVKLNLPQSLVESDPYCSSGCGLPATGSTNAR